MALSTALHIVTGKGGTGKTTIAAALAMSLARDGKKVLLCEVEGRQSISQLFDVAPLPYAETRLVEVGGEVYALAVDAESALLEYLAMYYKLGRAGKALDKFGIIDFATTIAPGVRDVLLTGKVYEAARRRKPNGSFVYDAVVVDAPPTGRIARFLGVNDDVAGLAKVGPVKRQSESIMTMMRSATTKIHLVTLAEEMPVQETLDGVAELSDAGLPVGHIIVNLMRPDLISTQTQSALASGTLSADVVDECLAPLGFGPGLGDVLRADGLRHSERLQLQHEQLALLDDSGLPVDHIPQLASGIDLGALHDIADLLVGLS